MYKYYEQMAAAAVIVLVVNVARGELRPPQTCKRGGYELGHTRPQQFVAERPGAACVCVYQLKRRHVVQQHLATGKPFGVELIEPHQTLDLRAHLLRW